MHMHVNQHRDHLAHQVLLAEMQLMSQNFPLRQSDLHTAEAERLRVLGKLLNKLKR